MFQIAEERHPNNSSEVYHGEACNLLREIFHGSDEQVDGISADLRKFIGQ